MMNKLHILLIDDNIDLGEGLSLLLEDEGYEVTHAVSGELAIELCREQLFDIVFADLKLPGMSGLEALCSIREMQPDVTEYLMTGFRMEQVIKEISGQEAIVIRVDDASVGAKTFDAVVKLGDDGLVLVASMAANCATVIQSVLADKGYPALLATKAGQALQPGALENIKILILDLESPILVGLEVYMMLKQQAKALPIVIVKRGKQDSLDISKLKSVAITGCLFKPFEPDALLDIVQSVGAAQQPDKQ